MLQIAWLTCKCAAPHGFCSIPVAHIHGWTALVTALILFLQESAILSCLRPEPAAAEASICWARGRNLLLLPHLLFDNCLMPPVYPTRYSNWDQVVSTTQKAGNKCVSWCVYNSTYTIRRHFLVELKEHKNTPITAQMEQLLIQISLER